jgi:hypothetical protein
MMNVAASYFAFLLFTFYLKIIVLLPTATPDLRALRRHPGK